MATEDDEWWYADPWLDLDRVEPPVVEVEHDEDASAPWILYGPDGETVISQVWAPVGFARALRPGWDR